MVGREKATEAVVAGAGAGEDFAPVTHVKRPDVPADGSNSLATRNAVSGAQTGIRRAVAVA